MNEGILPDIKMFVPLFIWHSGTQKNISVCEKINKLFFNVDQKVLLHMLMLNRIKSFPSKYPKEKEEENDLEFYHNAVIKYFDWTEREFKLNFIDNTGLRTRIARVFAFDNNQRKKLGLDEIKFKKEKFVKIDSKNNLGRWC